MSSQYSRKMIAWAICALLAAMLAAQVQPGRADIGWPPLNPAGASPGLPTGFETNVRMLSEEVNITIEAHERPAANQGEDSPANAMRAQVEAVFLMRNLGKADETFDVWFPLAASLLPGHAARFSRQILAGFQAVGRW